VPQQDCKRAAQKEPSLEPHGSPKNLWNENTVLPSKRHRSLVPIKMGEKNKKTGMFYKKNPINLTRAWRLPIVNGVAILRLLNFHHKKNCQNRCSFPKN
jgi:hypothetical protein